MGLAAAGLGPEAPRTEEGLTAAIKALQAEGATPISVPACPLMHGTGLWLGVFIAHFLGGTAVTFRNEHFDPDALWRLIARERATSVAIVGDAFAKPMLAALPRSRGGRDLARSVVAQTDHFVGRDVLGRGEARPAGVRRRHHHRRHGLDRGQHGLLDRLARQRRPATTARFVSNPTTKVFNERDEEVQPGSDEVGMIANGGFAPVGYYKDPEKSARTFRIIDGHRYSFPGDFAKVAADGSLILLGRGSVCINTGGEKVFPEEVEEALKAHDGVCDAWWSGCRTTGSASGSPPWCRRSRGARSTRTR